MFEPAIGSAKFSLPAENRLTGRKTIRLYTSDGL